MEINWNNIYLIASTISLITLAYLAFREGPSKRDSNVATAMKNLSDSLNLSTNELAEALVSSAKLRDELDAERQKTQARILENMKYREEKDEQIAELQEKNEALESGIAALKKQTENDSRETGELKRRVVEMEDRYNRMKRINERLVEALKKAEIPLPDLGTDLTDSVSHWKWPLGDKPDKKE